MTLLTDGAPFGDITEEANGSRDVGTEGGTPSCVSFL